MPTPTVYAAVAFAIHLPCSVRLLALSDLQHLPVMYRARLTHSALTHVAFSPGGGCLAAAAAEERRVALLGLRGCEQVDMLGYITTPGEAASTASIAAASVLLLQKGTTPRQSICSCFLSASGRLANMGDMPAVWCFTAADIHRVVANLTLCLLSVYCRADCQHVLVQQQSFLPGAAADKLAGRGPAVLYATIANPQQ